MNKLEGCLRPETMKPKVKRFLKWTGISLAVLLAFGINARRVSRADSEVIADAAMAVAYTKDGEYLGYTNENGKTLRLMDLKPGGFCLIARNWIKHNYGQLSAPNVIRWNVPPPEDDSQWDKAWDEIKKKHPKLAGCLYFSLPIYSPSGDMAYLYYEVIEGPLYGGGGYLTMKKEGDKWVKVADDITIQY